MSAIRVAALGIVLACVLLLRVEPARAIDPAELSDPQLQARYIALTHELRCVKCQNEALADSDVDIAAELRREVREMLQAGKTDEQIRDYMVARYSEFILFKPRYSARNAWLWLAPVVLLALGVAIAWRVIRGRTALLPADVEPVSEDPFEESVPRG
jgi:cytochrome c-type biogenesis protein CcmH